MNRVTQEVQNMTLVLHMLHLHMRDKEKCNSIFLTIKNSRGSKKVDMNLNSNSDSFLVNVLEYERVSSIIIEEYKLDTQKGKKEGSYSIRGLSSGKIKSTPEMTYKEMAEAGKQLWSPVNKKIEG